MAKKQKKLDGETLTQLRLSEHLAKQVDAWADDALSVDRRWNGTTETTHRLLRYWFDRDADSPVRFHDCQRRAIETLVYCHEVLRTEEGARIGNLADLYHATAPDVLDTYEHIAEAAAESDYEKYCLKLATGTGKTWILQAALVWQYFNAKWESEEGYSEHFLVVTPGLVVLERLLDAFLGKKDAKGNRDYNTADFKNELFMPPEWRNDFHLRILRPEDVNPASTPFEGAFVLILNWHKLLPKDERQSLLLETLGREEAGDTSVMYTDYLTAYPDLVVFNDEAHHVHNKAKKGGAKDLDAKWLQAVKNLRDEIRTNWDRRAGLFMQVDFSATPFYGAGDKKEFFAHIVYDYDLKHAMHGFSPVKKNDVGLPLVKQLFLEERQAIVGDLAKLDFRAIREEPEDGKRRGTVAALSPGQLLLLEIGLNKLDQIQKNFEESGIEKKPVLYVVCEENEVADMVAEHLRTRSDAKGRGLEDELLVIHSDAKERIPEDEWKQAKYLLDTIDEPETVNPKRIVISVLMLREGFDVRNICVAVILRSSESDILLEQMVGRGLRLMFGGQEYHETKRQALEDIAQNRPPSALLDFLFIVEHPRFRQFYENLRREGYPVTWGDSSKTPTGGDLTPVPYDPARLPDRDLAWPIQFHDEGRTPDPSLIQVSTLPRYPKSFADTRKEFDGILIADRHEPTDSVTNTWRLYSDTFSYDVFLRETANRIVLDRENTILSGRRAELMALLDDYVSTHLFGEKVDFQNEDNYRFLAHIPLYDFVVTHVRKALVDLLGKVVYEPHPEAVWNTLSMVPKILVRSKNVVVTNKSIYPKTSPAPKGGGFEARFMGECLEKSSSVLAYAKLDPSHRFTIRYRNEFGIARDYYPDFIVKTAEKMYLVETKADRDMSSPVVARKAKAAIGWCETASRTKPPGDAQPAQWEYVLLSEKTYGLHGRAGFDALLSACRSELQQLVAFGQGRLF